jgi:DNA-binding response OmpR family regulator
MSLEGPILIAEDDKKTAALVELYLKREGFRTVIAYDGAQALEMARRHNPGFVILDLMLPVLDGWEVCRRLRQGSDVPVLMLTARGEEVDRVSGLTLGADDYVVKPFSPRELVARVRAILRRGRQTATVGKGTLSHGDLVLDVGKRTASRRGRPLALTPHEYRLLQAFLAAPGKVFTRQELLDQIYPGGEAVIERVIDVHIGKLRHKIEDDPAAPCKILTVRGIGYQLDEGGD